MKLMTKFNLILLVLFVASGVAISQIAYNFLSNNARHQVLKEAKLLMASADAVRDYTSANLEPVLTEQDNSKGTFHAEMVPNFGAVTTFKMMQPHYPDYSYREAALNPRNPEHRAVDWEADIITWLRNHPDQLQIVGEREAEGGRSLYLARPLVADESCIGCHGSPSAAPRAMVALYGATNGFGWKAGEVVAAQIVSIPMSVPVTIAKQAYQHLLFYLIATLLMTIVALDAGVYWLVIRPLKLVSETADRVSTGEKNVPPLPVRGKDEIATVTAAFNRMQVSLAKALRMLG